MKLADIPQLQNATNKEKLKVIDYLWTSLLAEANASPSGLAAFEREIADHESPFLALSLADFKRRDASQRSQ